MSYVYLLHFSAPVSNRHTCQHYLGFAEDLAVRVQKHQSGNGSRLVQVALQRGLSFELVRVWRGGRSFERKLKNRKEATRLCPICNPGNRYAEANELSQAEISQALIPF
jgi:predicted GIY-YIG superfamily endonuclease